MRPLIRQKLSYKLLILAISFGSVINVEADDDVIIEMSPLPIGYQTETDKLTVLAERGDAQAQYELANTYGNNSSRGFDWYQKAANQNHPKAQTRIGRMYSYGNVVVQDDLKALEWFRKAADQGEAEAQNWLGVFYDNGRSIRINKTKAKEWYGKACDNGYQEGCDRYKRLNH